MNPYQAPGENESPKKTRASRFWNTFARWLFGMAGVLFGVSAFYFGIWIPTGMSVSPGLYAWTVFVSLVASFYRRAAERIYDRLARDTIDQ